MDIIDIFNGTSSSSIKIENDVRNMFISLNNKNTTYNLGYKGIQQFLFTTLCNVLKKYFSYNELYSFLKTYDIQSSEKLSDAIIDNMDYLIAVVKLDLHNFTYTKNMTRRERLAKDIFDSYDGHGENPYKDEVVEDKKENVLVVRTHYGTHKPLMYTFDGELTEDKRHQIRMMYYYETKCNYFETRDILYSNWINLPEEYQMASAPYEEEIEELHFKVR